MRGGALEVPFAAPMICRMSFRTGPAREIAWLSQENSEPLFDAWRLKHDFCVSRQNHLTAQNG
jgi:hypothetical protein